MASVALLSMPNVLAVWAVDFDRASSSLTEIAGLLNGAGSSAGFTLNKGAWFSSHRKPLLKILADEAAKRRRRWIELSAGQERLCIHTSLLKLTP